MQNNFTTSVNIIRDNERNVQYIPTPNATQVVDQIVNDFKKGIHSFNIVGTYGTGKSSFLLAFEQSIRGIRRHFEPHFDNTISRYDFIKLVGTYSSITECFADELGISVKKNKQKQILAEILKRYHSHGKNAKIMFIIIDEFGKYLEYASKNNPDDELYFIQQLAEFCNNPSYNIVLITTVHQGLDSYGYTLTNTQKQEWTKVKGRFREITFNEPVEQLLFLASEHIPINSTLKAHKVIIDSCKNICLTTKAFNFNYQFVEEICTKLYPLDILSATILTQALQRYGQNERSLFSFLESTDQTGLSKFTKSENPFYNISCVYDYLFLNYFSFLTSKYNPDFSSWSTIRSAIEKVERVFDEYITDYIKAIKTIGLLNIFSANGAILDGDFYTKYFENACGISDSSAKIKNLEERKIIRYRFHNKRYILFEGTDLDIQKALIEAGNKISEIVDIPSLLNQNFIFKPEIAKLYTYEIGTPRYFKFVISDYPIEEVPEREIDGYVNLIFSDKYSLKQIAEVSKAQMEAIIYCHFKNSKEIKNLLFEIEKIKKVINENKDDKVAQRELENIAESQKKQLTYYITDNIFSANNEIKWYFRGENKIINSKKDFNKLLSRVCNFVYDATPIFKNELVNKHRISASIHSAKRKYFKALANNWHKENLGFEDNKFPPEKTIYYSLLKENGISTTRNNNDSFTFGNKLSSFIKLWEECEKFIKEAKKEQKKISDLVFILGKRPFKLKQGFIDFWIPSFLFIKREEFALFNQNGYIPTLSEENLELLSKYPDKFFIKTFDIEGIKLDIFNSYRIILNQSKEMRFDNTTFIETIKPFIIFYKQLPEYSRQTMRLSQHAIRLRQAIATSRNPEETFFNSFPNALGITLTELNSDKEILQKYISIIQESIRELRTSYEELINRFEEFICNEFIGKKVSFNEYKLALQIRFSNLKKHLLLKNQTTFVQRLDSSLDDKKAWLNSICQAVIGKSLDIFNDQDEIILYERFKSMILELDSLTNISKIDVDENLEDIIGVKIDTFFSTINPKIVRIPRSKKNEIDAIKASLKEKLGKDRTSNLAAVLNLLKELMQ
jgi:hypothetical protein